MKSVEEELKAAQDEIQKLRQVEEEGEQELFLTREKVLAFSNSCSLHLL